jgi:hypothetical protein
MDMRCLIFKILLNLPFYRHFNYFTEAQKAFKYQFIVKFEAALNEFKLLYLCPEKILTPSTFSDGCLISLIVFNHYSICGPIFRLCVNPTQQVATAALFRL